MKPIISTDNVKYNFVDGKLIENMNSFIGLGRRFNLAALGKILRGYKTTKRLKFDDQKRIRIFYSLSYYGKGMSPFAYVVPVGVDGPDRLSIGCVTFAGADAKKLRRVALENSKVLA
jgi:hypothetical protein